MRFDADLLQRARQLALMEAYFDTILQYFRCAAADAADARQMRFSLRQRRRRFDDAPPPPFDDAAASFFDFAIAPFAF